MTAGISLYLWKINTLTIYLSDSHDVYYAIIDISDLINDLVHSGIFRFCNDKVGVQRWIYILLIALQNDYVLTEEQLQELQSLGIHIDPDRDYAPLDNYMAHTHLYFEERKKQMEDSYIMPRIYVVETPIYVTDNNSILMEYK